MGENKIDITSTMLESTIDGAKGFLGKLLGATVEEYGLMLADNVKLRRFKNQLKMVTKAQKIVEESGINTKQISIKQLVPLLEYSSLEEDESLQDKWAKMLVNFADSEKVYESSIYPFILSQLSVIELETLDNLYHLRGASSFNRLQVDGMIKANLIRLGIAELIIDVNNDKVNRGSLIFKRSFLTNKGKLVITELGVNFYECCSPKSN